MRSRTLHGYWRYNPAGCLAGMYIILSAVLKAGWNLDIGIPCLWRSIFHKPCPGCGLTRAGYCLLTGDLQGALQHNPLILIVVPVLLCYGVRDFRNFRRHRSRPSGTEL